MVPPTPSSSKIPEQRFVALGVRERHFDANNDNVCTKRYLQYFVLPDGKQPRADVRSAVAHRPEGLIAVGAMPKLNGI